MRQLLTRIDDELHRELKRRAAAEGRSVNTLVTELLRKSVAGSDKRELLRARIRALGRSANIPRPGRALSLDAIERLTRGAGPIVSQALEEERSRS
jgi:plasmid stability protein